MRKWRTLVQTAKYQIYISRAHDPFLNLSIEHYLLQKSRPESKILFLYINAPCIVIGRNQNPWLEVNLDLLRKSKNPEHTSNLPNIELVRRRSGGGTVFHDCGNVNYSVICPPAIFTRDKHAEMVTKAIRTFNGRARVNERHDIVLDGGSLLPSSQRPPESDMHRTEYAAMLPPLKVSGSAYKMVRNRCLHHGTCLVASPNLSSISKFLQSPARAFMKARGVDSVPSPMGNASNYHFENENQAISSYTEAFQTQVISAFADMYGLKGQHIQQHLSKERAHLPVWSDKDWAAGFLGSETLEIKEIADGVEELKVCSFSEQGYFQLNSNLFV